MQKTVIAIVFLFATGFLHAQVRTPKPVVAASLTGAILPLPGVSTGVQPGILWRWSLRFSTLTEFTLRTGKRDDRDSEAVNRHYWRLQQEFRYHFGWKKKRTEYYTGLRLAYAQRKFNDINSGFYATERPGGSKGFYYDKASISSPVFTTSLQFGVQVHGKKKLSADIFSGIGARFIKTTYSGLVNPAPGTRSRPSASPAFYASYDYNGAGVWFHANAGLRLVYHFGKL